MRGLEWGRLYEQYHSKSYDPTKVSAEIQRLYGDPYVKKRRGVFEYILGGLQDPKLAAIRSKVWKFSEMDADHVSAWSQGGGTSAKNCQVLCVTHNRAKGNR